MRSSSATCLQGCFLCSKQSSAAALLLLLLLLLGAMQCDSVLVPSPRCDAGYLTNTNTDTNRMPDVSCMAPWKCSESRKPRTASFHPGLHS
jgi:hypothetical protein